MEDSVNTRENGPLYFLVDNGSLRPEATINLRKIAQRLSERVGKRIEPVSLLHSHKIASDELGGESARILFPTMRAYLETGSSHFVLIPLFFGPSRALTEYIPGQVERLKARFPELKVTMAPTLVSIEDEDDCAMVEILQAQIDEVISAKQLVKPNVIMVDHGTPANR